MVRSVVVRVVRSVVVTVVRSNEGGGEGGEE